MSPTTAQPHAPACVHPQRHIGADDAMPMAWVLKSVFEWVALGNGERSESRAMQLRIAAVALLLGVVDREMVDSSFDRSDVSTDEIDRAVRQARKTMRRLAKEHNR